MFVTLLTLLTATIQSIFSLDSLGVLNTVLSATSINMHSPATEVAPVSYPNPSPFRTDLAPVATPPERLIIPSAQIDIKLVPLGVDASGRLDVPSDPSQGGWYFRSAKVGEDGAVLIDAHYDDVHGRPAAFYNLKRVKVGDKLILVDSYGRQFPYRVTDVKRIDLDMVDRVQQLFSDASKASLILITCGGRWLPDESTYSARLVVHSVLEK